jgi:hypothetical protein
MNPIACHFAALTVSMLYCLWRRHQELILRKQRVVRQRVALMLWVIAQGQEESDSLLPAS